MQIRSFELKDLRNRVYHTLFLPANFLFVVLNYLLLVPIICSILFVVKSNNFFIYIQIFWSLLQKLHR